MTDLPALRPVPILDRDSGRIVFPLTATPADAATLGEFLRANGVRADVADGGVPAVQLVGIPNLDMVEALIQGWCNGPAPTARMRRPPAGP